jgi:hypothetical protein
MYSKRNSAGAIMCRGINRLPRAGALPIMAEQGRYHAKHFTRLAVEGGMLNQWLCYSTDRLPDCRSLRVMAEAVR